MNRSILSRSRFAASAAVVGLSLAAMPAIADVPAGPPRVSPMATVSQVVGVSEIEISYSRPAVRERTIWGDLVPYDKVWRTGANEATTFRISNDAMIDGQKLPAGEYALFTIPGKAAWTVVFHREADQWGSGGYDAAGDALRVEVTPRKGPHQERMWIGVPDVGPSEATVELRWAELIVPFQVAFDPGSTALAAARRLAADAGPEQARSVGDWARWMLENDVETAEAETWMTHLADGSADYRTVALLARLQKANGNVERARATAARAVTLAAAAGDNARIAADAAALEKEAAGW